MEDCSICEEQTASSCDDCDAPVCHECSDDHECDLYDESN